MAVQSGGGFHWLWYYLGWIDRYAGLYHGLFQIQGFERAFAAGFLMTAMPRFLETPGTRPWELLPGRWWGSGGCPRAGSGT